MSRELSQREYRVLFDNYHKDPHTFAEFLAIYNDGLPKRLQVPFVTGYRGRLPFTMIYREQLPETMQATLDKHERESGIPFVGAAMLNRTTS